ncbi:MAG: CotH kinase family protein [Eubacteriales bacterium]|nr:CotH kinase family protein [Eubacteriales bacterium]
MGKSRTAELILALCALLLLAAVYGSWRAEREEKEEAEAAEWLENSFYIDTMTVDVAGSELEEQIRGWHNWLDGLFCVALPAYASGQELVLDWEYADGLLIDGQPQQRGRWSYTAGQQYVFSFVKDAETVEEFAVVFLEGSGLPSAFVNTDSGSMEYVDADKKNREEGSFYLTDETGELVCSDRLTYIKGRGNTTWEREKKPYSIKLSSSQDILGMGAARRWELLANFYDGSHMRNQLVTELAREAGMEYTPQMTWVDLYLNGKYQGLYQISEKVEAGAARVDIGAGAAADPADQGYLFVMEDGSRFEAAQEGKFSTAGEQYLVIKSPEDASEEEVSYLKGLVGAFEDAVTAPDGRNPESGKSFEELIDLDSFAKKYLVEEIAKNSDAVTNSQYFYKKPESDTLYAGPVWDYDNALGHTSEEAMDPEGFLLDHADSDSGSNLWYGALNGQDAFRERAGSLYREIFSGLLKEACEEKIESWRELLRDSAYLDELRWKDVGKDFRYRVCEDYDGYVDYLKDFVNRRRAFLDGAYGEASEGSAGTEER